MAAPLVIAPTATDTHTPSIQGAAAIAHLRLDSLQALRGVAAMLVVLYHTSTIYAANTGLVLFSNAFRSGFTGVNVFFVLSGFVIFWVHGADIGRPVRAPNFVAKRAFRLLPVYWVVVLMKLLKDPGAVGAATVFGALLLLPTASPFITVAWTLSYELLFYGLFLLLIVLPRGRWSLLPIGLLLVLATVPRPALPMGVPAELVDVTNFAFSKNLLEFAFGVIVAWVLRGRGAPSVNVGRGMALAGLLAFVLAAVSGTMLSSAVWAQGAASAYEVAELRSNAVFDGAILYFGVPAALLIAGMVSLEMHCRLWLPFRKQLAWVGDLSYSLYLVHGFVIQLLLGQPQIARRVVEQPGLLVLAWSGALLMAWLCYRMIEIPAMRVGRRWIEKK